jgi:predicted nuclease of predicted toxin-antitoxin system
MLKLEGFVLSLRLLLDADIQDRNLIATLESAGYDVRFANEAGLRVANDDVILSAAVFDNRAVLTYNCDDYRALHMANPNHCGIVAVYKYSERRKNLSDPEIIRALANLESSGWDITGQFVSLNQWNF